MAQLEPDAAELTLTLPITIRTAVRDDLPKLEFDGSFTKFRNLFRKAFREQQSGLRLMLVADCNTAIVGRLFILFRSSDESIADGRKRAYLYSFYVMTPFRGMGLGTAMVLHAEQVLVNKGFRLVTIAVAKDNVGAIQLYQRLNYDIIRDDPGHWSYTDPNGRTHQVEEPCWILEKVLDRK